MGNIIMSSENFQMSASLSLFMVSGRVSKIYAGKQSNQKCVFILPGLMLAKVVSIFFGRARGRCGDLTAFKLSRDQRDRLKCPAGTSSRGEISVSRGSAGRPARLNSFLPLQLYLQPFCWPSLLKLQKQVAGRQAISWWCFFLLALCVYVWRLKTHCSECDNKRSALFTQCSLCEPHRDPNLTRKKGSDTFSTLTEEMALN